MTFQELFNLCRSIMRMDSSLIDDQTTKILRSAAKTAAKGDQARAGKYLKMIKGLRGGMEELWADNSHSKAMSEAMTTSNFEKVLRIYDSATRKRISLPKEAIGMVVEASIKSSHHGDISHAVDIIKHARLDGLDVTAAMTPLLWNQIEGLQRCAKEDLDSVVKGTITSLTARGLHLPPAAITKATDILVSRGRNQEALNLWTSATAEDPNLDTSLDIVSLTVLLKASFSISNYEGVKWIMSTMCKRDIMPDSRFKLLIKNNRREAKRWLGNNPNNVNAIQRYEVLEECFRIVNERRSRGLANREEAEKKILLIMKTAAKTSAAEVQVPLETDHILGPISHNAAVTGPHNGRAGRNQRSKIPGWTDSDESEAYYEPDEMKRNLVSVAAG